MKNINLKEIKEEQNPSSTKKDPGSIYFYISIWLFTIVLISSIYLYISNLSLAKNIENTRNTIVEYQDQITSLKNDNSIMAYGIVKSAMPDIEKNILKSQVYTYVDELGLISKKYKIDFSGFSYQDGNISTSATSEAGTDKKDAVEKISSFIKDYRDTNNNLFILNPIAGINWDYSKRDFQVEFSVK